MRPILLLARRELATYFNTWWGWTILAVALLLDGLMFNAWAVTNSPQYSTDVLEQFFYCTSGTTMIAGVLITMRLLAEERQTGTMVLLETAPISEAQIVLGKFLGAFGFLAVITLLTVYMPVLIQINGKVSWSHIAVGYVGLLALGGTAVAIGTFGSAVAQNQLLAAVFGGVLLVLFVISWYLARVTEDPVSSVLSYAALFDRHFQPFMRGRINTENLVYYASITFAFLLMSTRALQVRRWR